jgi:chromosome segregation ATPase
VSATLSVDFASGRDYTVALFYVDPSPIVAKLEAKARAKASECEELRAELAQAELRAQRAEVALAGTEQHLRAVGALYSGCSYALKHAREECERLKRRFDAEKARTEETEARLSDLQQQYDRCQSFLETARRALRLVKRLMAQGDRDTYLLVKRCLHEIAPARVLGEG